MAVELVLVRRRPVREQALRIRREHEHAVAPVRAAVPGRVAGRHEEVARRRVDDRSRAAPDRGVARLAARRLDQLVRSGRRVQTTRSGRSPGSAETTWPCTAARRRCSRRSQRARGRAVAGRPGELRASGRVIAVTRGLPARDEFHDPPVGLARVTAPRPGSASGVIVVICGVPRTGRAAGVRQHCARAASIARSCRSSSSRRRRRDLPADLAWEVDRRQSTVPRGGRAGAGASRRSRP